MAEDTTHILLSTHQRLATVCALGSDASFPTPATLSGQEPNGLNDVMRPNDERQDGHDKAREVPGAEISHRGTL